MSSPRISRGDACGLVGIGGELDAACLSAAAGQHLRLHDDLAAELGRGRAGLLRRRGHAALGDRDAELREQLLALMLVEVHRLDTTHAANVDAAGVSSAAMPFADQLTLARIAAAPLVVVLFTWDFPNHDYWGTVVVLRGDVDRLVRRAGRAALRPDDVVRLAARSRSPTRCSSSRR